MTREEYLSKLANELHYDEERIRVVIELLSAAPKISDDDFDEAWATSKLAWRLWRTLMQDFDLSLRFEGRAPDLGSARRVLSVVSKHVDDVRYRAAGDCRTSTAPPNNRPLAGTLAGSRTSWLHVPRRVQARASPMLTEIGHGNDQTGETAAASTLCS